MRFLTAVSMVVLCVGCSEMQPRPSIEANRLAQKARSLLVTYTVDQSPLLRAHAIEALAETDQISAVDSILDALEDEHPGVRFAACMAILRMRYDPAEAKLIGKLQDTDHSVRVAAAGALRSLGNRKYSGVLANMLIAKDAAVRRNTALVLGRIGERGAIKLLRKAQMDDDISVRLQVVEAMAALGDENAQRLMINCCSSAFDDEAILAMLALGQAGCSQAKEKITYIYEQSRSADRLGMQLVAARALALLGDDRGQQTAREALTYRTGDAQGAARIRNLAAIALSEMRDPNNLKYLQPLLDEEDPDVRIAGALAVLKCLTK
jgi:HEAT repeat protein